MLQDAAAEECGAHPRREIHQFTGQLAAQHGVALEARGEGEVGHREVVGHGEQVERGDDGGGAPTARGEGYERQDDVEGHLHLHGPER